jgi:pimeloyl-ACP methyl ester carboxylesterase
MLSPNHTFLQATSLAGWVLAWLLAGYLLAAASLWYFQDDLLLHPSTAPASSAAFLSEGQYVGELHAPAGAVRATVVFFHGNGGTVADREFVWKSVTALGYRAVLLEYPGYGARAGVAHAADFHARGIADLDLVRARFPKEPLIVAGESFGAGVAAAVAGTRARDVCSVVLITPWNRLSELVQEKLPMFPAKALLNSEYASDIALRGFLGAVTIVAAEQDMLIPVHHARKLFETHPSARWELLLGVGHNTWPQRADEAAWQRWLTPECGMGRRLR